MLFTVALEEYHFITLCFRLKARNPKWLTNGNDTLTHPAMDEPPPKPLQFLRTSEGSERNVWIMSINPTSRHPCVAETAAGNVVTRKLIYNSENFCRFIYRLITLVKSGGLSRFRLEKLNGSQNHDRCSYFRRSTTCCYRNLLILSKLVTETRSPALQRFWSRHHIFSIGDL